MLACKYNNKKEKNKKNKWMRMRLRLQIMCIYKRFMQINEDQRDVADNVLLLVLIFYTVAYTLFRAQAKRIIWQT